MTAILIKYSEIILKGMNRSKFEAVLVHNLRVAAKCDVEMHYSQATIYVNPLENDAELLAERFARVFGVSAVVIADVCGKELQDIYSCVDQVLVRTAANVSKNTFQKKTFKVETKRADKKYPLKSPEISASIGGYVLERYPLTVDVNNPEITINVEIREKNAYVYTDRIKGPGGIPVGTGGRGLILLSGGLDSPVAGYMMAKRGVHLEAAHFYSYPYTTERAKDKVIALRDIMQRYCSDIKLHLVPFAEVQLAIRDRCPDEHSTILMRRIMMYVANALCAKNNLQAIITGESLGQVASQTIDAIAVVNQAAEPPVLRPLIGMNKEEIIDISRHIDTYDTSILPYEDCCTVFTPKHPTIKPRLEKIMLSEKRLDIDKLVSNAIDNTTTQ